MKWTTSLSRKPDRTQAFREACANLDVASAAEVDVLLVFFSAADATEADELAVAMASEFPEAICVGCNATGVIGDDQAEDGVSLAVTAGTLPGVEIEPIRFEPDVHDRPTFDWKQELGGEQSGRPPHFLILSEPSSFETEGLLAGLDEAFPDSEKFGALVSGNEEGVGNKLILEGHVYDKGAVGLAFSGDLRVDTVVAQACRPIGEPLIVTDHSQNIIHRFNRGNPMEVFRNLVHGLAGEERELAQHSMFVGIGMESPSGEYRAGDFIIRNIIGFNPKSGDLAVAAPIEDLDVLQFHLMDPKTSSHAFEQAMDEFAAKLGGTDETRGALLFSGSAHNNDQKGKASQESELVRQRFGPVPIGGISCDGEIAQVGHKTWLHGYASMVAVFREAGRVEKVK